VPEEGPRRAPEFSSRGEALEMEQWNEIHDNYRSAEKEVRRILPCS